MGISFHHGSSLLSELFLAPHFLSLAIDYMYIGLSRLNLHIQITLPVLISRKQ